MSFADSMDDLDAMNDLRNTAASVAAAHEAKRSRPGKVRRLLRWLQMRVTRKAS